MSKKTIRRTTNLKSFHRALFNYKASRLISDFYFKTIVRYTLVISQWNSYDVSTIFWKKAKTFKKFVCLWFGVGALRRSQHIYDIYHFILSLNIYCLTENPNRLSNNIPIQCVYFLLKSIKVERQQQQYHNNKRMESSYCSRWHLPSRWKEYSFWAETIETILERMIEMKQPIFKLTHQFYWP